MLGFLPPISPSRPLSRFGVVSVLFNDFSDHKAIIVLVQCCNKYHTTMAVFKYFAKYSREFPVIYRITTISSNQIVGLFSTLYTLKSEAEYKAVCV